MNGSCNLLVIILALGLILKHALGYAQNREPINENSVSSLLDNADTISDHEIAYGMANKALELSRSKGSITDQIEALLILAKLDIAAGNDRSAIKNGSRALSLCTEFNISGIYKNRSHVLISTGLERLGAYSDAIFHRKELLKLQLAGIVKNPTASPVFHSLNILGNLYMHLGSLDSSLVYYKQSLSHIEDSSNYRHYIHAYNNIGLSFLKKDLPDSASLYFRMALTSFDQGPANKDSFYLGMVQGNLAKCLSNEDPLKSQYFLTDYHFSYQAENWQNAIAANLNYCDFLIETKQYQLARDWLIKADELVLEKALTDKNVELKISKLYVILSIASGNLKQSKLHFEHYNQLIQKHFGNRMMDSLLTIHSSYEVNLIEDELAIEKIQNERDKARIDNLNKANELASTKFFAALFCGILLLVIAIIIILKIRGDAIKRNREKELKNRLLKMELKYNSERLDKSILSLSRKKEFAEDLFDKIRQIENINDNDRNNLKFFILNELEIDENLISSEEEIQKLGTEFITRLKNKFPDLTENDIKLLGLIKMKLTNKQIAEIKNITPESVKIAKNRLRKKLNLKAGSSFSSLLEGT